MQRRLAGAAIGAAPRGLAVDGDELRSAGQASRTQPVKAAEKSAELPQRPPDADIEDLPPFNFAKRDPDENTA